MRGLSAEMPLSAEEAARLILAALPPVPSPVVLAVSGGPDSTALMGLYAQARAIAALPPAVVATVNHGLRAEAQQEAVAVGTLARKLGFDHRILHWEGDKPATGLQDAARAARYRLIGALSAEVGAKAVLTGHTLDDQAETVLMRLLRGSGVAGLGGMDRLSQRPGFWLVRPFLDVAKARLVATCTAEGWPFAADPSNANPDFTRVRMRALLPLLAAEGLDAARLSVLARRMRATQEALDAAARRAMAEAFAERKGHSGYDVTRLAAEPAEVIVSLFRLLITARRDADEAPVRLNRIEALAERFSAAMRAGRPFAATLGGVRFSVRQNLLTSFAETARRTAGSADKVRVVLGNSPDGS